MAFIKKPCTSKAVASGNLQPFTLPIIGGGFLSADATFVYLHAQLQAIGLYRKFGFEIIGPEFEEAGIRHSKMMRK